LSPTGDDGHHQESQPSRCPSRVAPTGRAHRGAHQAAGPLGEAAWSPGPRCPK
jgi:hypothetical protein